MKKQIDISLGGPWQEYAADKNWKAQIKSVFPKIIINDPEEPRDNPNDLYDNNLIAIKNSKVFVSLISNFGIDLNARYFYDCQLIDQGIIEKFGFIAKPMPNLIFYWPKIITDNLWRSEAEKMGQVVMTIEEVINLVRQQLNI